MKKLITILTLITFLPTSIVIASPPQADEAISFQKDSALSSALAPKAAGERMAKDPRVIDGTFHKIGRGSNSIVWGCTSSGEVLKELIKGSAFTAEPLEMITWINSNIVLKIFIRPILNWVFDRGINSSGALLLRKIAKLFNRKTPASQADNIRQNKRGYHLASDYIPDHIVRTVVPDQPIEIYVPAWTWRGRRKRKIPHAVYQDLQDDSLARRMKKATEEDDKAQAEKIIDSLFDFQQDVLWGNRLYYQDNALNFFDDYVVDGQGQLLIRDAGNIINDFEEALKHLPVKREQAKALREKDNSQVFNSLRPVVAQLRRWSRNAGWGDDLPDYFLDKIIEIYQVDNFKEYWFGSDALPSEPQPYPAATNALPIQTATSYPRTEVLYTITPEAIAMDRSLSLRNLRNMRPGINVSDRTLARLNNRINAYKILREQNEFNSLMGSLDRTVAVFRGNILGTFFYDFDNRQEYIGLNRKALSRGRSPYSAVFALRHEADHGGKLNEVDIVLRDAEFIRKLEEFLSEEDYKIFINDLDLFAIFPPKRRAGKYCEPYHKMLNRVNHAPKPESKRRIADNYLKALPTMVEMKHTLVSDDDHILREVLGRQILMSPEPVFENVTREGFWLGIPVADIKSVLYPASGIDTALVGVLLEQFPFIEDIHLIDNGSQFPIEDSLWFFAYALGMSLEIEYMDEEGARVVRFYSVSRKLDQAIKKPLYSHLTEVVEDLVWHKPFSHARYFQMRIKFPETGRRVTLHFHRRNYLQLEQVRGLEQGSDLTIIHYMGLSGSLTAKHNRAVYSRALAHTKPGRYIHVSDSVLPRDASILAKLVIISKELDEEALEKGKVRSSSYVTYQKLPEETAPVEPRCTPSPTDA